MSMDWKQLGTDGNLAREIIKAARASRKTIKTISAPDREHAVLVWIDSPRKWHYWRCQDGQWQEAGVHSTVTAAREQAEADIVPEPVPEPTAPEHNGVVAKFPGGRPITVPCSSDRITEEISDIFRRLGCEVKTKEVSVLTG